MTRGLSGGTLRCMFLVTVHVPESCPTAEPRPCPSLGWWPRLESDPARLGPDLWLHYPSCQCSWALTRLHTVRKDERQMKCKNDQLAQKRTILIFLMLLEKSFTWHTLSVLILDLTWRMEGRQLSKTENELPVLICLIHLQSKWSEAPSLSQIHGWISSIKDQLLFKAGRLGLKRKYFSVSKSFDTTWFWGFFQYKQLLKNKHTCRNGRRFLLSNQSTLP